MSLYAKRARWRAGGLLFVPALAIMGASPQAAHGGPGDSIVWRADYAYALDEARVNDRLLWIQFTAPWCPNCTRMERDTFPIPAIVRHSQRSFVTLKLRSDLHEELAAGFNLSALPATVVITPEREVLAVHQGYLGPAELDALLSDVVKGRCDGRLGAGQRSFAKSDPAAFRSDKRETKAEPPLGLSGYCPVSLICQRKLIAGRADCEAKHAGRMYRFASAALFEQFQKDPTRFVPAHDGYCPVNRLDRRTTRPGDPRWGVIYRGQLFVCATEEDRLRFIGDPRRYAIRR
jgi:YHS domain-containing protein